MTIFRNNTCAECSTYIDNYVFSYSINAYRAPLCKKCQKWFEQKKLQTTNETVDLYFALRERGVPAELEKFDGKKTIDIAVVEAKVNIEVDGRHHTFDPDQALTDLKRTYYAFKDGFLTLRIPNSLVQSHLDQTAHFITEFLLENRVRN